MVERALRRRRSVGTEPPGVGRAAVLPDLVDAIAIVRTLGVDLAILGRDVCPVRGCRCTPHAIEALIDLVHDYGLDVARGRQDFRSSGVRAASMHTA